MFLDPKLESLEIHDENSKLSESQAEDSETDTETQVNEIESNTPSTKDQPPPVIPIQTTPEKLKDDKTLMPSISEEPSTIIDLALKQDSTGEDEMESKGQPESSQLEATPGQGPTHQPDGEAQTQKSPIFDKKSDDKNEKASNFQTPKQKNQDSESTIILDDSNENNTLELPSSRNLSGKSLRSPAMDELPTELDLSSRHPLHSKWVLWFMDGDKKKNQEANQWGDQLIPLFTIEFVEDFWLLYAYILQPAKLRVKNDYMLFREGIEPKWEDPRNQSGGKWQLVLPNKHRNEKLDAFWLDTVLSMIGENYRDLGIHVNGAYLQRRQKEDRISLWTDRADLREENETIGKVLKMTLRLSEKSELHYLKHETTSGDKDKKNQSWHRRNQEHSRLYKV